MAADLATAPSRDMSEHPSSPEINNAPQTSTNRFALESYGDGEPDNDSSTNSYFLKSSKSEVIRLQYQHETIKACMGGLVFAPIDLTRPNLHILDSTTADGYWLRDLGASLDNPTLIGGDITEQYFPAKNGLPPKMLLLQQDINAAWPPALHGTFDLVHQRLGLPGCGAKSMPDALQKLVGLVKPGGWIQLLEADYEGEEYEYAAMRDAVRLIVALFKGMGVEDQYARKMKGWIESLGLKQAEERVVCVPLGAKNTDQELALKSKHSFVLATMGLVDVAKGIPGGCGFTQEQLGAIVPDMERAMSQEGGFLKLRCVIARKPKEETDGQSTLNG